MDLDLPAGAHGTTVNLSLISHTNAGKTTLARTLLGRDVGEVRDAAHVTEVATGYVLVQQAGDTLMLWDTPGFGDTARLLTRLRNSSNPIGWFLTQVWDRWKERPLWSSQQAVKNAREQADIILYLVNAAEDPAGAAYVPLEMEVLQWIGKPVVLLLNQMGPPRAGADDEVRRWHEYLAAVPVVRGAMPMDAFARCWVQEGALFDVIEPLLPPDKQPAMERLTREWQRINLDEFDAAMRVLGASLVTVAQDREPVGARKLLSQLTDVLRGGEEGQAAARKAMAKLAERVETETLRSTEELIRIYGLSGKATRKVLERMGKDYQNSEPASEGFAAMLGGVMSGALGGLAADVAAGGLTLGGGMIVGGILGALGAGTLAKGYNLTRGEEGAQVKWSDEFFEGLVRSALLRYLAVAHFGRGRGDYSESEHPAHWQEAVAKAVEEKSPAIRGFLQRARSEDTDRADLEDRAARLIGGLAHRLLVGLYPQAAAVFDEGAKPLAAQRP